jgi:hypothetical protein
MVVVPAIGGSGSSGVDAVVGGFVVVVALVVVVGFGVVVVVVGGGGAVTGGITVCGTGMPMYPGASGFRSSSCAVTERYTFR